MKTKPGDRYRVTREQQGRVYITDDSFYCEGTGKFPVETQAAADELYKAAKTYLERNKEFERVTVQGLSLPYPVESYYPPVDTSIFEPKLPDKLKPGVYELSMKDGFVHYRSIFSRFLRRLRHT